MWDYSSVGSARADTDQRVSPRDGSRKKWAHPEERGVGGELVPTDPPRAAFMLLDMLDRDADTHRDEFAGEPALDAQVMQLLPGQRMGWSGRKWPIPLAVDRFRSLARSGRHVVTHHRALARSREAPVRRAAC